jgi:hypothetical protein
MQACHITLVSFWLVVCHVSQFSFCHRPPQQPVLSSCDQFLFYSPTEVSAFSFSWTCILPLRLPTVKPRMAVLHHDSWLSVSLFSQSIRPFLSNPLILFLILFLSFLLCSLPPLKMDAAPDLVRVYCRRFVASVASGRCPVFILF